MSLKHASFHPTMIIENVMPIYALFNFSISHSKCTKSSKELVRTVKTSNIKLQINYCSVFMKQFFLLVIMVIIIMRKVPYTM